MSALCVNYKFTSVICAKTAWYIENSRRFEKLFCFNWQRWKQFACLIVYTSLSRDYLENQWKLVFLFHLKNEETNLFIKRNDKDNVKRFLFQGMIIGKYKLTIICVSKARQWKCIEVSVENGTTLDFLLNTADVSTSDA